MVHERYEWSLESKGIIRIMLAKGSNPCAYVFSSCNEKVRELVFRGTKRTKREGLTAMKSITCKNNMVETKGRFPKQQELIRQTQISRVNYSGTQRDVCLSNRDL